MPKLDRTGPNGNGPRTGRELGSCNTNQDTTKTNKENQQNGNQSNNQNKPKKALFGRGLGCKIGRGFRNKSNKE